jgi:hypothetical protein
MPPALVNTHQAPLRSRRGNCLPGCLTFLVLLLLIVGAGWFFVVRPYLHDIAIAQLDSAMSSAVEQIPPQASQLSPGPLTVTETTLTNLLVLNTAPSSPIQHPTAKINPNGVRIEFQTYGSNCAVTIVPQVQQGQLVATNVTVEGIIGLILSSDDIRGQINKYLAQAQARIQHRVQSVLLKNHEMDIVLG